MALLGDDGRGYELARKLESVGVWRSWLGDSLYANFFHYLSSPSSWESFMRTDDSITRAHLHLQLRARALLFDKASVSLFLRSDHSSSSSSSSSALISKLNPNYLKLHGDDVYFTLEDCSPEGVHQRDGVSVPNSVPSKLHSKAVVTIGSRYGESELDNMPQRFRHEELPETWYSQFFAKYRAVKPYKLSFGEQETDKRTPEQMANYLRISEKHKRRRVAFREDHNMGFGIQNLENGSNKRSNSVLDGNDDATDDETLFFPESMFLFNTVPDSALPPIIRVENQQKVEFNGVLDKLPQIIPRSAIMIERLGIRPDYLSMEGGRQGRGKNGSEGNRRQLSQDQASQMSKKVIARVLTTVGFDAAAEVPVEVFSQLLSCHISKLGRILKVLSDSYRKECSAIELIKMFLHTAGYGNLGALSEIVKENTRSSVPPQIQPMQGVSSQFQPQHQTPLRQPQPQQMSRQMHNYPQLQQMVQQSQNLDFQQQQWDRMRRRQQPSIPRPIMNNMNMNMNMERPMMEVKIENPSEFPPMDSSNNMLSAMNALNARQSQMQFHRQQQQQLLAMSNFQTQPQNQFRQLASLQVPPVHSPNTGIVRAQPVKVDGFKELMGGDTSLKQQQQHDSEENKLTSPLK